jgi:hypothetical protein
MAASTHTDEDGNVIAVYDDDDLGVYKHSGTGDEAKKSVEANHSADNTSAGGEKMGETAHIYSFADYNKVESGSTGNIAASEAKIDFSSTWAGDKISESLNSIKGFIDYQRNADNGQDYDLKTSSDNPGGEFYGSRLADGTIVSARDAGNILAGVVSRKYHLPKGFAYNGFGAFNAANNNRALGGAILIYTYAVKLGSAGLINPQRIIFGHTRGEDIGSFNGISYGINNYKGFIK